MNTKAILIGAMITCAAGLQPVAQAASVTMVVDTPVVGVGQIVTFNYVMDFTDDSTLGGGTDFYYDPNVLQFIGWEFDPNLTADEPVFRRAPTDCTAPNSDAGCAFDPDEFGPGMAQVNGLSFGNSGGAGIAGPETIGQMTFIAVGQGSAQILMVANDDGVAGNPGPFVSGNSFQIQPVDFFSDIVSVGPADPDPDGDGVPFNADNCTERANPLQIDSDGDGIGNACDADLNNDCTVNPVDLGIFRARFFTADPDADFDGNGVVNTVDLGILRTLFFLAPGPSGVENICN